jgi:hypothetical protein
MKLIPPTTDAEWEERRQLTIVRRDNCTELAGQIKSANLDTGEVEMMVPKIGEDGFKTVSYSLGSDGFRVLPRSRR